jgi:putative membrane protein
MNALTDITPLVAHATWHDGGGWWFPFGLLWLVVLGLVIWLLVRRPGPHRSSAAEILADRYARGEIGSEEYRERLDELRRRR